MKRNIFQGFHQLHIPEKEMIYERSRQSLTASALFIGGMVLCVVSARLLVSIDSRESTFSSLMVLRLSPFSTPFLERLYPDDTEYLKQQQKRKA